MTVIWAIAVSAVLVVSLILNAFLLEANRYQRRELQKFCKPFDPKVSVYVQRGGRHGWVTAFEQTPNEHALLSDRPVDAAVTRLSGARLFVNSLVDAGFYVRVCRVVHPEHWKEGYDGE